MAFLPGEQGESFKINLYDHGSGVAAADIDADGDDDLFFLNQLGANRLYRNNGDGTFTDITAEAGPVAMDDRICVSAAFNDLDNDGDEDLYVTSTRGGNALFRNDGKGRFTDVTDQSRLTWIGHSQSATFFDADGDGDLDLFLANTAGWTTDAYLPAARYYAGVSTLVDLIRSPIEHNAFFRNGGEGTFTNATEEAGLRGTGWGGDTAAFDYDGDGDQDLFVANMFGGSILYRNDGRGRFEDVTDEALGRTPWGAVGAKVLDFDGDGRLDLYVVDMHSDMWMPSDFDLSRIREKRKYETFYEPLKGESFYNVTLEEEFAEQTGIDPEVVFLGNGLFRNLGGGRFEEISDEANAETFWPWGIAAGDFDNDGYEDAYLPSGMGHPWTYWRSPLLHNNGDGTFTDIGAAAGVDPPPGGPTLAMRLGGRNAAKSARSAIVSDLDADGRLDLVVNNFNDRAHLFMNRSPKRNFIAFRLEGTRSNRDAVGAVVRIRLGDRTMAGLVHAAGGYLAQSSKTVHFGLGEKTRVDRCEISWPSGRVQVLEAPAANRIHAVKEPAE
jgi:hypothetical protein